MLPRITVKNAGPGSLAVMIGLWQRTWYEKVAPEAHHAYRMQLLTTPWARKNLQVLVLEENGAPLSGLIALTFPVRMRGHVLKVAGVAAVVTEPAQRGRGLAARLLSIAHRRFQDSGHDAALLFSDIGTPYYEKLSYVPWPTTRHALVVPAAASAPAGVTVREATARDLTAMRQLYERFQAPFSMALERPLAYWRHLMGRARWRDRMLGQTKHHSGRWIAEVDGEPVAYARVAAREIDLAVTEAAHLPGHAPALAHLVTERARALSRDRLSMVAPASLTEALGLCVAAADPVDKMMMAPLSGRAATADQVQPLDHCFWAEDWF